MSGPINGTNSKWATPNAWLIILSILGGGSGGVAVTSFVTKEQMKESVGRNIDLIITNKRELQELQLDMRNVLIYIAELRVELANIERFLDRLDESNKKSETKMPNAREGP